MPEYGGAPMLRPGLVDRVKAILLRPKLEWPVIDVERTTIADLYRGYVIPLAAIGPVCAAIGALLFGYGAFGVVFRPSIASVLSSAVVSYVLSLVMVYVMALIIDALAPTFNGTRNREQAFKVAAYASTASWVAGVFGLLPQLGLLAGLAGLYSLYLLYLGLPLLMRVAQDKAIAYIALIVVAAIVLFVVLGAITAAVTSRFVPYAIASHGDGDVSGVLAVPGGGSVDLGKLAAASKQMAAAAQSAQAGGGAAAAVAPATLQALLPAALPGLARTAVSSASAGAAGIGGATAEARYGTEGTGIKLTVTDLGAAGGLAGLAGAFNVQSSQQDGQGYEKVGKIDGRMVTEKWNTASRSGSYSMLVAPRFMIAADGDNVPMDAVKAAVAQVDAAALERLAK